MTRVREVVITGTGVVSPIGVGKLAYWTALEQQQSGVGPITLFDPSALPVPFGAEVRDFDAKQYVTPRKSLKVMCREIQLGFAAARLALDDAGLIDAGLEPDRFGVVYAGEMFYCAPPEMADAFRPCVSDGQFDLANWGQMGMSKLYPLWMLMYLPNMIACHIAIANDARGHNNTISVGESSSLLALLEAARVIQRGLADVVIAGGAGNRLNVTPLLYRGDALLSHRLEDPQGASRPFDAGRDGMVNGEGAGAFVLESRAHAVARGAKIQARILGGSESFQTPGSDDFESGRGIVRSIQNALRHAEVSAPDIGHVNAHGDSTIDGDRREARAIREVLGEVPVTAVKSYFGNLGSGGGAIELAASVLGFAHGRVPATLNYDQPDPACPVSVIHGQPLRGAAPVALALNQSVTGQTAALVLAAD